MKPVLGDESRFTSKFCSEFAVDSDCLAVLNMVIAGKYYTQGIIMNVDVFERSYSGG